MTAATQIIRPTPPQDLPFGAFQPAGEVERWIRAAILHEKGAIHNLDHAHLSAVDLRVVWTSAPAVRQMRTIAGTAELPQLRGLPWVKARQEWQMIQWFGDVPDALITLSAPYANQIDDVSWCALVEHELYHLAHALDQYGCERWNRETGKPVLAMRGHDAEEFVGVVRRYGAGAAAGGVAELVAAAQRAPEVAAAAIAGVCGTCSLRVA